MFDLPLGLLAVKKTSKEASSRRAIFTMEQPGVVTRNFAQFFTQLFELFLCISRVFFFFFCNLFYFFFFTTHYTTYKTLCTIFASRYLQYILTLTITWFFVFFTRLHYIKLLTKYIQSL